VANCISQAAILVRARPTAAGPRAVDIRVALHPVGGWLEQACAAPRAEGVLQGYSLEPILFTLNLQPKQVWSAAAAQDPFVAVHDDVTLPPDRVEIVYQEVCTCAASHSSSSQKHCPWSHSQGSSQSCGCPGASHEHEGILAPGSPADLTTLSTGLSRQSAGPVTKQVDALMACPLEFQSKFLLLGPS
jgi:hypothetical protein